MPYRNRRGRFIRPPLKYGGRGFKRAAGALAWGAGYVGRRIGKYARRRYNQWKKPRRSARAARLGYFGSRQISRKVRRVRMNRDTNWKRHDMPLGSVVSPIPFRPWISTAIFQELQWNGICFTFNPPTDAWGYTATSAPIQGSGPNNREGYRVRVTQNQLRLCIDAGDGLEADPSTDPHLAICCRVIAIQIFGDTDLHALNSLTVGHFFNSDNITSFMNSNIGDLHPQLKKFKVLVDRTFTSSELDSKSADQHLQMDFPLGDVEFNSSSNASFADKGSRVIFGLFHENVTLHNSTTEREKRAPHYYGTYKIKFKDIPG